MATPKSVKSGKGGLRSKQAGNKPADANKVESPRATPIEEEEEFK